jgi:hypothetical protein
VGGMLCIMSAVDMFDSYLIKRQWSANSRFRAIIVFLLAPPLLFTAGAIFVAL